MQGFQQLGMGLRRFVICIEPVFDHEIAETAEKTGHLQKVVFGVVLHAPEDAAVQRHRQRLNGTVGVRGEDYGVRRRVGDLVEMDGEGVEDVGAPLEQRASRVKAMRRANPISRPRGLGLTVPPATTTAT